MCVTDFQWFLALSRWRHGVKTVMLPHWNEPSFRHTHVVFRIRSR